MNEKPLWLQVPRTPPRSDFRTPWRFAASPLRCACAVRRSLRACAPL